MIQIDITRNNTDLTQILNLQERNLKKNISKEEAESQGYVTVVHSLYKLQQMANEHPHVIAKNENKVIAYALSMVPKFREIIPELYSLFKRIDKLKYNDKKLINLSYFVMGQVCIDKNYRGMGIFEKLYQGLKKQMKKSNFDYCITSIAQENKRSINAHLKTGFEIIHSFSDKKEDWIIVLLKV